jgi:hypothetical protein
LTFSKIVSKIKSRNREEIVKYIKDNDHEFSHILSEFFNLRLYVVSDEREIKENLIKDNINLKLIYKKKEKDSWIYYEMLRQKGQNEFEIPFIIQSKFNSELNKNNFDKILILNNDFGTSYVNSVLQILLNLPLIEIFLKNIFENENTQNTKGFLLELYKIIRAQNHYLEQYYPLAIMEKLNITTGEYYEPSPSSITNPFPVEPNVSIA